MYLSGYKLVTTIGAAAADTFIVTNFNDSGDFFGHKCYS